MDGPEVLVFFSQVDPVEPWRGALEAAVPDLVVRTADALAPGEVPRYALVWKPPLGFFARFPALRLVTILGAGADALAGRDDLPPVPVTRIVDPEMTRMMSHYVLFAALRYARDIPVFEAAQRERRWAYVHPRPARRIPVGVLGLGALGGGAAAELARQGFTVRGWSRSPKTIEAVRTHTGAAGLEELLTESEIVVVMLPLTPATRHLLDGPRIASMRKGATLINVSRGAIIDEDALVQALASGHLAGATLDVFAREPLDPASPLWAMPSVLITPHLASVAIPETAAEQIADNIARVRSGRDPLHRIEPGRDY